MLRQVRIGSTFADSASLRRRDSAKKSGGHAHTHRGEMVPFPGLLSFGDGVLSDHQIKQLIANQVIHTGDFPFEVGSPEASDDSKRLSDQIQPASLDLTLGSRLFRMRASFLPGKNRKVEDYIDKKSPFNICDYEVDLSKTEGAILDPGIVYIVELQEHLDLSKVPGLRGRTNPKSSTGRLDILTRVICDNSDEFDTIPAGYDGPLYAQITPMSFTVHVRQGTKLNQIRFRQGDSKVSDDDLKILFPNAQSQDIRGGLTVHVNLSADEGKTIGYSAQRSSRRNRKPIDVDKSGEYEPVDYWESIPFKAGDGLILDTDGFYLLASKEAVAIPPGYAAEMIAIDPMMGEFRAHYAGFFDPGFGDLRGGSKAVLEVRIHDVPFLLEDGQPIARLVFEKLSQKSQRLYGTDMLSNYQGQGLKLSKHFK